MADLLKGLFGRDKPASTPIPAKDDSDFADFAEAPDPSPASISAVSADTTSAASTLPTGGSAVPYTKWYRVWERASVSDFYQEFLVLALLSIVIVVHLLGARSNRRRAKAWIKAHAPILHKEFASVGFGGRRARPAEDDQSEGKTKAEDDEPVNTDNMLREKAVNGYVTYATGRQNVAAVDIKLTLFKRHNPLAWFGENALSFFFDSFPAPVERMEAVSYAFDGKESQLVPVPGGEQGQKVLEQRKRLPNSTFDGFVWAIVHKDAMKRLREERYDLSLTTTKDHPKLPVWATTMTESAEISDALLTPELVQAVEQAGEALQALIVSDQPIEQPKKLNETVPKKRISLSMDLSSSSDYQSMLPLFQYYIRMQDHLVAAAHFRPEAMRKIRHTREEEIRKIKRIDEEEKAEERRLKGDKEKKEKRDAILKNLSAEEQRKYLEKEREKDLRKSQKKRTMRA